MNKLLDIAVITLYIQNVKSVILKMPATDALSYNLTLQDSKLGLKVVCNYGMEDAYIPPRIATVLELALNNARDAIEKYLKSGDVADFRDISRKVRG